LYEEINCRRTRIVFAHGRYRDKTKEFGGSSLQSQAVEYVWKVKGDGEDNARIGKCACLSEGGSWTNLAYSLPRSRGAHGENKKTSEGGINN
jgi:hypothetical protein